MNRSIQEAPHSALCQIRSETDDDEIEIKKHEVSICLFNPLISYQQ